MIPNDLKGSFNILNGGKMYVSNITQFTNDQYGKLFKDKVAYRNYLDSLSHDSKSSLQKIYKMTYKYILNNVVPVSSINSKSHTLYGFTDNFIIAYIPDQSDSQTKLRHLLSAMLVHSIVTNVDKNKLKNYVATSVFVNTKFLSKAFTRAIDKNEVFPVIARILSAWYLKMYNSLSLKNLDTLLSANNVNFVSASDTQSLIESMNGINNTMALLNLIGSKFQSDGSALSINYINKFSLDMLLSLESLYAFVYNVGTASIFQYPPNLYFGISSIKDNRITEIVNIITHQYLKKAISK